MAKTQCPPSTRAFAKWSGTGRWRVALAAAESCLTQLQPRKLTGAQWTNLATGISATNYNSTLSRLRSKRCRNRRKKYVMMNHIKLSRGIKSYLPLNKTSCYTRRICFRNRRSRPKNWSSVWFRSTASSSSKITSRPILSWTAADIHRMSAAARINWTWYWSRVWTALSISSGATYILGLIRSRVSKTSKSWGLTLTRKYSN